MSKLLPILAAALLSACANIADAGPGNLADVAVINRSTGERLPIHRHRGRLYVEGQAGERYAVELRNRTGGRILTVLSVDGVNAVTGRTAAAHQSGYVLDPWSRAEIAGWRKDMAEVAAFYFTALPDSYAARTGRPDNVGVIGVAVYAEKAEPPRPPEIAPEARAPAAPASQAAAGALAADAGESSVLRGRMAEQKLGTGHGERIHAPTTGTEFRRAGSAPGQVITIYYDSRANLVAQGIIPRPAKLPLPFPNGGFVPDPA
jgi:hypothetical protein